MIDKNESYPRAPAAIVTGAGRNIGRAIALELAAAGLDVALVVRSNRDEADSVAKEVEELGRKALVGVADVRRTSHGSTRRRDAQQPRPADRAG